MWNVVLITHEEKSARTAVCETSFTGTRRLGAVALPPTAATSASAAEEGLKGQSGDVGQTPRPE